MEEFRKQIDQIDEDFVKLLAKRAAVVKNVAEHKVKNDIATFQPDRERLLLEKVAELAAKEGTDPIFVNKIYILILEQSKKEQDRYRNMA